MSNLKVQFRKAWELINASENIFVTTHEGTDGDDLGSLLAMKEALEAKGKKITAVVKGGVPDNLQFLPGSETVQDKFADSNFDLVITFGCNKISRTGWTELESLNCPVVNFDHHPDNTNFGAVNVVDASTAAVAELIYYFLNEASVEINKNISMCLLTGIFADTGGFKHANTSSQVLEVAAKLMKKGARIEKISGQLMSSHKPSTVKAWAKGLENARFDSEKKLVFSVMTEEDLKDAGATDEDLDGFVELLNNIPQAKFALLLRQDGDTVKGSLRSEPHKKVDVSKIAKSFGGGGHKLASGFKLKGKLTREGNAWKII